MGNKIMSHFDLCDRLRSLGRGGTNEPFLKSSEYMPVHVERRKDGVEVYIHDGRTVEVRAGEVIDSHGNVVNLERLEREAFKSPFDETSKKDKYRF